MRSIWIPIVLSIALVSVVFVCFENLEVYFQELLDNAQGNKSEFAIISFLVLSSDIILPVPSSIVMYSNGLVLGFAYGLVISLLAVLISSCVGYYLGRFTAWGSKNRSERTTKIIQKYGGLSIILTRGIPILSESICFTAGYNKLNFKSYFLLNLIGYLPVCVIYSYFGTMGQSTNLFLISFFGSIGVSALLWFFGRKLIAAHIVEHAD